MTSKNYDTAMAAAAELGRPNALTNGAERLQRMNDIDNLIGYRADIVIDGRPELAWPPEVARRAGMLERIANPPVYWAILGNLSPNRGTVIRVLDKGDDGDMVVATYGSANVQLHYSREPLVVGERVAR